MKKIVPLFIVITLVFFLSSCPDYLGGDPAGRWNPIDPEYDEATDPNAETVPDTDDGTITVTISRSDGLDYTTPVQSVTWTWAANVEGCTFRYAVTQDASNDFPDTALAFSDQTTAVQSEGDGVYYLYVQALGSDGATMSDAAVASALLDNTAPNAIVDLGASAGVNSINLYWSNPPDDFAGVELRYSTAGSSPSTPSDGDRAYNGNASSFQHTNLTPGTEYNYSIFTFDEAGNYSDRGILTVDTLDAATGPVTGFTASSSHQSVFLQWTNPVDAGFDGVMIRYSDSTYPATPTDGSLAYDGTAEEFDHMYLTQGHTYYYTAFAYDTGGYYAAGQTDLASALAPVGLPVLEAEYLLYGNGNDSSMNGNNLSVYGFPQPTADRFGVEPAAFLFDGSDDYMITSDNTKVDISGNREYSISIWFMASDVADYTDRIISKWSTSAGYEVYIDDPYGIPEICVSVNQTVVAHADIAGQSNEWIHVVFNYENPGVRLYVDNVQVYYQNLEHDPVSSTNSLCVGARSTISNYFSGIIDDVRIYDQALTVDQVSTLYHEWDW